jgi:hypothetical protein
MKDKEDKSKCNMKIRFKLSKEEVPTVNGYIYPKGFWNKIFNSENVKEQLDKKCLFVYADFEPELDLTKTVAVVEEYNSEDNSILAEVLNIPCAKALKDRFSSMKVGPCIYGNITCNENGIESIDLDSAELIKLCIMEKEN